MTATTTTATAMTACNRCGRFLVSHKWRRYNIRIPFLINRGTGTVGTILLREEIDHIAADVHHLSTSTLDATIEDNATSQTTLGTIRARQIFTTLCVCRTCRLKEQGQFIGSEAKPHLLHIVPYGCLIRYATPVGIVGIGFCHITPIGRISRTGGSLREPHELAGRPSVTGRKIFIHVLLLGLQRNLILQGGTDTLIGFGDIRSRSLLRQQIGEIRTIHAVELLDSRHTLLRAFCRTVDGTTVAIGLGFCGRQPHLHSTDRVVVFRLCLVSTPQRFFQLLIGRDSDTNYDGGNEADDVGTHGDGQSGPGRTQGSNGNGRSHHDGTKTTENSRQLDDDTCQSCGTQESKNLRQQHDQQFCTIDNPADNRTEGHHSHRRRSNGATEVVPLHRELLHGVHTIFVDKRLSPKVVGPFKIAHCCLLTQLVFLRYRGTLFEGFICDTEMLLHSPDILGHRVEDEVHACASRA